MKKIFSYYAVKILQKFLKWAYFDGVNDRVRVPSNPLLDIEDEITLEAEIFRSSNHNGGIICKWTSGDQAENSYLLYIGQDISNGRVGFSIQTASGVPNYPAFAPSELPLNEWRHYAATFNGTEVKMYENGVLVDTVIKPYVKIRKSIRAVTVGALRETDTVYNFHGGIRNARIWKKARTSDEIKANSFKTIKAPHSDLVLNIPLEGTADDISGNGLETQAQNGVTFQEKPL